MAEHTVLIQAMHEWASAIRGDWSEVDGRSVRDVVDDWAAEIAGNRPTRTIEQHRAELGLCADGNGHWGGRWGHCGRECPTFVAEEKARARA